MSENSNKAAPLPQNQRFEAGRALHEILAEQHPDEKFEHWRLLALRIVERTTLVKEQLDYSKVKGLFDFIGANYEDHVVFRKREPNNGRSKVKVSQLVQQIDDLKRRVDVLEQRLKPVSAPTHVPLPSHP